MKRYRYIQKTLLLTMLLVLSAGVLGNNNQDIVKIEIEAPSEVLSNEDFIVRYTFSINEYTDELSTPEIEKFTDFEVVSEPRQQAYVVRNFFGEPRAVNITVTYRLSPKKKGLCNLPQAKYVLHGKTYKSEKVKVNVIANEAKEKEIRELKDDEAFIRPIVSRDLVSPDDTLTVTYRLYSKVPIYSVESAYTFPLPRRDFYFNDLTNYRQSDKKETHEGKEYYTRDIRVLLLQPKGEGRKTIYGGVVELIYTHNTGRKIRDKYGRIVDEVLYMKKELKIDEIVISAMQMMSV